MKGKSGWNFNPRGDVRHYLSLGTGHRFEDVEIPCLPIGIFRSSPPLLSPPPIPHPAAPSLLPTNQTWGSCWFFQELCMAGSLTHLVSPQTPPPQSGSPPAVLWRSPTPSVYSSSCFASSVASVTTYYHRCVACLFCHLEYKPRERSLTAYTDGT